uniref:Uncharacterized protein n=1 Tax=Ciona savignyi TaxID=51511 RepID=H2ZMP3_CIOSA
MCPPSTNWYSPLAIGYSPEIVPWMTARSKNYANPCAGSTLSKVHTFMRQLRVVVLGLREKLDDVNEEIKSLSKMREGMARSLDQLSLELNQDKCEAVIKRPRFIKNRTREAKVDLWERGSDTVRMDRVQMLRAQAKIRKQYTYVKEQLQELSRIRNRILVITRERTRVLDLFPDVIVASTRKKQDKQEQQRTRSHQVMLQYASNKPGLNKSGTRATPNGDAQKFVKTGQNLKAAKSEMDFRKTLINKSTGRSKSAGPEKNTEKRKEAWTDNSATKCLCDIGGGHLPPVMTSECQDAINSVVQVRKSSQALRRQIHQVVEESFLVDQTVSPAKEPEQHGQYYGVACGGRSPHKRAMFIH